MLGDNLKRQIKIVGVEGTNTKAGERNCGTRNWLRKLPNDESPQTPCPRQRR
jgi:hypothetical protein